MNLSKNLIRIVGIMKKYQVRNCHHNSLSDQAFYRLYTRGINENPESVEEPVLPDNTNITNITNITNSQDDSWMNSHVRKTMLEGEKDDIFLL